MSDSFADLWSSSASLPAKPKPPTLSSASSTSSRPNLNQSTSRPDVFTLLSSSGTSTPTSRYGNGGSTLSSSSASSAFNRSTSRPSNPPSRTMTPSTSSQPSQASSASTSMKSDAFSDLFSSSTASSTSNMTLAARLAMEAEQQRTRTSSPGVQKAPSATTQPGHHDAWAGLDSLGDGMSAMPVSKPIVSSGSGGGIVDDEDDWGLGDFGKAVPTSSTNVAPSPPPRQPKTRTQTTAQSIAQAAEKKKGASLWDMEGFTSATTSTTATGSIPPQPASRPPSSSQNKPALTNLFEDEHIDSPDVDFDFGSREDRTDSRQSNKAGRGGLLDFDDRDRGYVQPNDRQRGMHRGLLHDGEDEGHGYGNIAESPRGGDHDEEDILGMLGKPVHAARKHVHPETASTRQNHDDVRLPTRPPSPPPHILGQIVEMGFSVTQAKKALAATKDGQDVQAALESLLGGSGIDTGASAHHRDRPPSSSRPPPPPAPPTRTRGAPKGQKERERERLERQRQQQQQSGEAAGMPSSVAEMQEHADRLLSQASEIGSSMFSKASAFWKEGKEKVVKAYEERASEKSGLPLPGRGTGNGSRGGGDAAGRPKWMQEVVHASDDEDTYERETSAFKDDHEHLSAQDRSPQRMPKSKAPVHEVDLFATHDEPQRRRNPSPQPGPQPVRQASSSSSIRSSPAQTQPRSVPAVAPVPIPTRDLVTASPSALSLAQKHKTVGTEQFKLGQHGTAAESYSTAISALPADHLLLIPLLTNRALTRLKTGEYAGAIADCEKALEVIVGRRIFNDNEGTSSNAFGVEDPLSHHSKSSTMVPPPMLESSSIPPNLITAGRSRANGGGWAHPQGVGVDLLDAYIKALRRAAEAFEGREKWVEACAWWGVLSQAGEGDGSGWVDEKARKEAVVGGVRCRKMVDGLGGTGSQGGRQMNSADVMERSQQQPAKPKPKVRPLPTKATEPSKALAALQSSNAQAEADDNAKYALKDSVDARLIAWKGGKETNIRALLASLETVLWEGASGAQGLKMGMADLVSAGQVKKGYMKAIARVHPDKLNAGNSTLEQRMLANGVFAGLNEAWISFQATQK